MSSTILVYGFASPWLALGILVFWLSAGYGEAGWNLNLLWAGPLPLLGLLLARGKKSGNLARILLAVSALGSLLVAILGGPGPPDDILGAPLPCPGPWPCASLARAGFFFPGPPLRACIYI